LSFYTYFAQVWHPFILHSCSVKLRSVKSQHIENISDVVKAKTKALTFKDKAWSFKDKAWYFKAKAWYFKAKAWYFKAKAIGPRGLEAYGQSRNYDMQYVRQHDRIGNEINFIVFA